MIKTNYYADIKLIVVKPCICTKINCHRFFFKKETLELQRELQLNSDVFRSSRRKGRSKQKTRSINRKSRQSEVPGKRRMGDEVKNFDKMFSQKGKRENVHTIRNREAQKLVLERRLKAVQVCLFPLSFKQNHTSVIVMLILLLFVIFPKHLQDSNFNRSVDMPQSQYVQGKPPFKPSPHFILEYVAVTTNLQKHAKIFKQFLLEKGKFKFDGKIINLNCNLYIRINNI